MNRTIILLLALALAVPASIAQLPPVDAPVNPTVEVTIAADKDGDGASIDAPATYTVTISNTSPGSTTGQDPPMDVSLIVTGAPGGWQVSLDQAAFQIPAGGSTTTTLTVGVTGSATKDEATITVEATIRSGAFPPLELQGTGSDSVDVMRDDSATREAQEAFGNYLWYIVGGGIALYLLSMLLLVLLFRKRGRGEVDRTKKSE